MQFLFYLNQIIFANSNNNIAHPEMEIDLDKYYCLYCW